MFKRKLRAPDNQLRLIEIEPVSTERAKGRRKPRLTERTASLEERVTCLEAEVTLIRGQLERDEDDD